jgi:hypothetical protein
MSHARQSTRRSSGADSSHSSFWGDFIPVTAGGLKGCARHLPDLGVL